jgi:hypothetical protein
VRKLLVEEVEKREAIGADLRKGFKQLLHILHHLLTLLSLLTAVDLLLKLRLGKGVAGVEELIFCCLKLFDFCKMKSMFEIGNMVDDDLVFLFLLLNFSP